MSKTIHVAMLVAGKDRADLAIQDLWRTAQLAVPAHVRLTGTAVYVAGPGEPVLAGQLGLDVVQLEIRGESFAGRAALALATRPGPLGVVGRLLDYNLASRRPARAMARNQALTERLCASDIVVSADQRADRALWKLRNKTAASLIHGPFAMANVLSAMARD
ncbi:hypothetical protein ACT3TS_10235 [Specibacter sp. AOP5-B1-6]|uniref:hypothetical protein n=1 Tax=Specibacter sp. AOP5-B1-6 TaxID=3457653 RepID=UPI00402B5716